MRIAGGDICKTRRCNRYLHSKRDSATTGANAGRRYFVFVFVHVFKLVFVFTIVFVLVFLFVFALHSRVGRGV